MTWQRIRVVRRSRRRRWLAMRRLLWMRSQQVVDWFCSSTKWRCRFDWQRQDCHHCRFAAVLPFLQVFFLLLLSILLPPSPPSSVPPPPRRSTRHWDLSKGECRYPERHFDDHVLHRTSTDSQGTSCFDSNRSSTAITKDNQQRKSATVVNNSSRYTFTLLAKRKDKLLTLFRITTTIMMTTTKNDEDDYRV